LVTTHPSQIPPHAGWFFGMKFWLDAVTVDPIHRIA